MLVGELNIPLHSHSGAVSFLEMMKRRVQRFVSNTAKHIFLLSLRTETANEQRGFASAATQRSKTCRPRGATWPLASDDTTPFIRKGVAANRFLEEEKFNNRPQLFRWRRNAVARKKCQNQARTVHHMSGQSGERAALIARQPFL